MYSLDHSWSLETQTPAVNSHVLWQTHRLQHFRSEHTAVTNLNPLLQTLVVTENLHRWLCVWVVCWLEAEVGDAHLAEEDFHEADQTTQGQPVVCDDTFDLVEFSQMRLIDGFVTEDTIDGEVACWFGVLC